MTSTLSIPADPLVLFAYLLKDVTRLHIRNFERHTKTIGWTMLQCRVLGELRRHQGCTQIQLAEIVETDPMTLLRLLDKMEREGWIERRFDAEDRRVRRLYTREAAEPVFDQIQALVMIARKEAMVGLSEDQQQQLVAMLRHVHGNLAALTESAASEPATGTLPTAEKTRPVRRNRRG